MEKEQRNRTQIGNSFSKRGNDTTTKEQNPRQEIVGVRKWSNRTPLEVVGKLMRDATLQANEWKKDIQYTKALVGAEYEIQQEFLVK